MPGLIVLDRDGVLNATTVDEEHGTIGSPLHPSQVVVFPWVPKALRRLQDAGWSLAVASNQPGVAKKQSTRANLDAVHEKVMEGAQQGGARILGSYICWHRKEDGCRCRKPRTGLLEDAMAAHGQRMQAAECWMVGDGSTDVEAGVKMGMKTAFLGPRKCDACKVFQDRRLTPDIWADNLEQFVDQLMGSRT